MPVWVCFYLPLLTILEAKVRRSCLNPELATVAGRNLEQDHGGSRGQKEERNRPIHHTTDV